MPSYIIKLEDKYVVWSTIVDAPISRGMSKEKLSQYIEFHYGEGGLTDLPERLKRVEEKGVSSMLHANVDELIEYNRAGPNETCLTKEQIIENFVR